MKMKKEQEYPSYADHYNIDDTIFGVYHSMFFFKPSEKILDVGCSTGNFLIHCSKDSFGIDCDDKQLLIGMRRGLNVKKCDLDKDKFPFNDND